MTYQLIRRKLKKRLKKSCLSNQKMPKLKQQERFSKPKQK